MSPAGSHKPNTAVPQAFYNKQEGIARLTTETGAGQWGSALSFACAQFDLECKVYMVRASFEQKPYRRVMMETWGGQVVPSPVDDPAVPGSLGTAISDAVRDAAAARRHPLLAGLGAQPRAAAPDVIGLEAKEQLAMAGESSPDVVIGSCGGGSNLGGIAFPFVPDERRAAGRGRAVVVPHAHRGPLRVRLRRHGRHDPAAADVHARPRLHPAAHPRRRAALPRRLADHLEPGEVRPDGGGRLPAGQGVRGRRAVRPHRGHDPRPRDRPTPSGPSSTRRWRPRRRARSG